MLTSLTQMVSVLFLLHLIGDFVLQRPFLSLTKSYWPLSLIEHVMIYALVLFSGVMFLFPGDPLTKLDFIFVNSFLHFLTDYYTSRSFKNLEEKRGLHNSSIPFINSGAVVLYGADQGLHYLALTLTLLFYFN